VNLLEPTPAERVAIEPRGCILLGWRGSVSHGIYVDPNDPHSVDDKDLMGIVIAPLDCYFGNKQWGSQGTREIKFGDWDVVHYEIRKMFMLLLQGNPNVVSLLWMPEDLYLTKDTYGALITRNRVIFSSKKMWNAFEGYAWSQHKLMTRGEYVGHMGAKRRDLFDKYGFDCKAAAHMIRLVRMAAEFYESNGVLQVWREDYDELLTIKRGEWSLPQVEQEFAQQIERASRACKGSSLPQEPDYEKAQKLLTLILCHHFRDQVLAACYR